MNNISLSYEHDKDRDDKKPHGPIWTDPFKLKQITCSPDAHATRKIQMSNYTIWTKHADMSSILATAITANIGKYNDNEWNQEIKFHVFSML